MQHIETLFRDASDPDSMMEMLGLDVDSITFSDYGRERGAAPQRSDAQIKAVEKLASRITKDNKKPKDEEHDDMYHMADFDLLAKPRVVLFQGKVNKKSLNSMVSHNTQKRLILFNDCLVLANPHGSYLSTTEMLTVNLVVPLDELLFTPYMRSTDDTEAQQGFEIRTRERPFYLVAESESDKRIWCEEIELAMKAYLTTPGLSLSAGWQHHAIRGTLHSAVCDGDISLVEEAVGKLGDLHKDIDDVDDYCMTALRRQREAVACSSRYSVHQYWRRH